MNKLIISYFKHEGQLVYDLKRRIKKALKTVFLVTVIATMSYLFFFPVYYAFVVAFQRPDLAVDPTSVYVPKAFSLDAVKVALQELDFKNSILLTLSITIIPTAFSLMSCSITGYAFARFNFKGKRIAFLFVLLLIVIPTQQIIVPQYMMYDSFTFGGLLSIFGIEINLLNTPFVFILPSIFSVGYKAGIFIFIFRQFFSGLPKEFEEAATIDGCGPFKIFLKIMIPNAVPAFVVVTLLCVIWHWNEFYSSSMFFIDEVKPLIVNLNSLMDKVASGGLLVEGIENSNSYMQRMFLQAGVIITITPLLVLYAFMQKFFVESIDRSGIVG